MINIAGGDPQGVDYECRRELFMARIPIVDGPRSGGEVATSVTGRLGQIVFRRAWSYWIASGPVPLSIARALYDDPIGRMDVRVSGHCMCPPPEFPWVEHLDADGKHLRPTTNRDRDVPPGGWDSPTLTPILTKIEATTRWVDDPEAEASSSFVDLYHIDSVAGLRLFADALRGGT